MFALLPAVCVGQVTSVFGRSGAVVANFGDYSASMVKNTVDTTQSYANPSWLSSLDWSKISGAPLDISLENSLAVGQFANHAGIGESNTAIGHAALYSGGHFDTAVGDAALAFGGGPGYSTAVGMNALSFSQNGYNTAVGTNSQMHSIQGTGNTTVGVAAMFGGGPCPHDAPPEGFSGNYNSAVGQGSFCSVTTGSYNALLGMNSGYLMTSGSHNVVVGYQAGYTDNPANANTTGSNNTWIGDNAGPGTSTQLTNSTAIGSGARNTDSNQIVIGNNSVLSAYIQGVFGQLTNGAGVQVLIGSDGKLGTIPSSRRYKEDIQDMGAASKGLLRLRPVTFRYRTPNADGSKPIEYGLVAEEVAEVYPDLVVRGEDGQVETVQYYKLDAMLLNEVQELARAHAADLAEIERLKSQVTELNQLRAEVQRIAAMLSANSGEVVHASLLGKTQQ